MLPSGYSNDSPVNGQRISTDGRLRSNLDCFADATAIDVPTLARAYLDNPTVFQ
jgi:hypothetical protein